MDCISWCPPCPCVKWKAIWLAKWHQLRVMLTLLCPRKESSNCLFPIFFQATWSHSILYPLHDFTSRVRPRKAKKRLLKGSREPEIGFIRKQNKEESFRMNSTPSGFKSGNGNRAVEWLGGSCRKSGTPIHRWPKTFWSKKLRWKISQRLVSRDFSTSFSQLFERPSKNSAQPPSKRPWISAELGCTGANEGCSNCTEVDLNEVGLAAWLVWMASSEGAWRNWRLSPIWSWPRDGLQ